MILSKEQRIGAAIFFGIALIGWLVVAVCHSHRTSPELPEPPQAKKYRTWEERKDSMRRVDSLRFAEWSREREHRYDSFHLADSSRRAEWKRIRQEQYDSFRIADSLWRDSVGFRYPRHAKKDTILDLNHCDTADLQYIRGIGRYTAVQIVKYRGELGGFYSTEQLKDDRLSKCHLDTLLNHFTADAKDVRMIDINSCSIETLQRHPYLRYNQAKAIYDLRRKQVRIHSLDELIALPEISEEEAIKIAPYLRFE